ncbi:hypothetical protein SHK09_11110 [Polaribacter sp. PL03]|uniref:hypothetical protein n=1 Tax=Polaribacter sp. PL03 TaxID=3088353 RepID=UPI0029CEC2CA|nr:hypothetical protein [Polaribacter sp. PL03]MDX6747343.1 hypothetical protein [Polaribacter sp. PL03]
MKKITLLTLLFLNLALFSQSKEFVIVDANSNKPVDLAQISYPTLATGSISNEDGKIRIPLHKQNILVSHINYVEKEYPFDIFYKKDTIFLVPKNIQLDEIIISNVDLKAKFSNILKKTYLSNYSTKRAINKSTYKETFKINDSLNRLFQVQLNWWSKEALFKSGKAIHKQNKIFLESVDYSKIKQTDASILNANGAYIANKDLFRVLHLNYWLEVLNNLTFDFNVKSIEKEKKAIKIYFDATLIEKGKEIYYHKNSVIVFDENYNYIKYLKLNMFYNTKFEKGVSRLHKIPNEKKTTKHSVELSFKRLKNNKQILNYFISEFEGIIKTKKYIDTVVSKQSIFISESLLDKKLKKENIDFYKPFFENLPTNLKNNDVKILLTKEEKGFLNSSN